MINFSVKFKCLVKYGGDPAITETPDLHVGGLFDCTNALVMSCSKYHTEISRYMWHPRKGEGICVFKIRVSSRITGKLFITTNTPNISLNRR